MPSFGAISPSIISSLSPGAAVHLGVSQGWL